MNLSNLLAKVRPSYEDLHSQALLFPADMVRLMRKRQSANAAHRVMAVPLVDGRGMVCADVLTEVGSGRHFHDWFMSLPTDRLGEVEVVPMDQARALLPPPPEVEEIPA